MGHSHAQGHGGDSEKRVIWPLLLTAGFMGAELAGGLIPGSLAPLRFFS